MKLTLNQFYLVIIVALVIVLILMRSCSGIEVNNKPIIKTVTRIDTVYKTIRKDSIITHPRVIKYIPQMITKYQKVDTAAILKDYFAKLYYQDTIKLDKFGYVLVRDTISQNKIINRNSLLKFDFPIAEKVTTNTITLPPKNQFYIGLNMVGSKKDPINYFGPSLIFKSKADHIYSLGLGLSSTGTTNYQVGIAWKIKIK